MHSITKTAKSWCKHLLVFIVILLVILLPSVNSPELIKGTETGKVLMFAYATLVITTLFVFCMVVEGKSRIHITLIDLSLFVLVGYMILNRFVILKEGGLSVSHFEFGGLCMLYVIFRNLSTDQILLIMFASIVGGIVQCISGHLQLYGYFPSNHEGFAFTGSFFNPGAYAGYLASIFPMALGLYLFKTKMFSTHKVFVKISRLPPGAVRGLANLCSSRKNVSSVIIFFTKAIPLITTVAIVLIIVPSQSRAAWLGVLFGTLVLLYNRFNIPVWFSKYLYFGWRKLVVIIVVVALSAGLSACLYAWKKDSADGRLLIYKVTVSMVGSRPFFGYGFDRFEAHYMNYQAIYFENHGGTNAEQMVAGDSFYAFNELLQFVAENGIVGFGLILVIVIIIFFGVTGRKSVLLTISISGLVSIFLFSMFSYPFEILPIKLNFILVLATLVGQAKHKDVFTARINTKNGGLSSFVKGVILVCFCIMANLWVCHLNELKEGYRDWKEGLDNYQSRDFGHSLRLYEKALPFFRSDGEFLQHFGKSLFMNHKYHEAIEILEQAKQHKNNTIIETALGDSYKKVGFFQRAEDCYLKASYMVPSRFYPKYLLAILYDQYGYNIKAMKIAQDLLRRKAKVESMATQEIRTEMEKLLDKGRKPDLNAK